MVLRGSMKRKNVVYAKGSLNAAAVVAAGFDVDMVVDLWWYKARRRDVTDDLDAGVQLLCFFDLPDLALVPTKLSSMVHSVWAK